MTPRTPAPMAESIRLVVSEGIAHVTLARPEARNAFNGETIERLHDVFARITAADDVRAVVLAGEGKVFCGGADINWMRESLDLSFDANVADAERMSDMFRTIDNCPKPVIGQIHGAALGGGAGLAAVCDIAIAAVPELATCADKIGDAFSNLAKLIDPVPAQRVHGDYHLGQVMRTQTGWIVLDFEGEPASPLAQRRARSSPLRDVAGMLRSFEYAARHQLLTRPDAAGLAPKATEWVRRNSEAFCAGYAAAGGLDPAQNWVLLRAMLLDKAVYEVIYEARNRPTWLSIPLESIAEL